MPTPEDKALEQIDKALESAGWHVQDDRHANVNAGRGVVIRNVPLASGYGVDYVRRLFPCLLDQQQIFAEVERRLFFIDELEVAVECNLICADWLQPSILAKAFCGGLTTL